jgi:tetratricopeptide (TPR) repeat protein
VLFGAAVLALMLPVLAVELAAMTAVDRTVADARALRGAHHYPEAIAEYRAAAGRSGPAYLLARGATGEAAAEAEGTTLDWANALAAMGQVDQALDVSSRVTAPDLALEARRVHAQIALGAARAAAVAGRFEQARERLGQLNAGNAPADLVAQGEQLRPSVELGLAGQLVGGGGFEALNAVAYLDDALRRSPTGAIAARAQALLPRALLEAGEQLAAAGSADQARTLLQRCVDIYRDTPEGLTAATLLANPQPVTGVLVGRDGAPAAAVLVRLAGGFRRQAGSGFTVSGPFLFARTDGGGSFRLERVPLGVPLVFEFFDRQGWELIVDETRNPAYRVEVQPLVPTDMGYIREP